MRECGLSEAVLFSALSSTLGTYGVVLMLNDGRFWLTNRDSSSHNQVAEHIY